MAFGFVWTGLPQAMKGTPEANVAISGTMIDVPQGRQRHAPLRARKAVAQFVGHERMPKFVE
jgi:hypothetical protein